MPSSTIPEWVSERERSPYRTSLYYKNGKLILHQEPGKTDDLIRFPFYNIFIANRELFDNIKIQYPLAKKYYFQPKRLSMDLYGDVGLWHILLALNKCRSSIDFISEKIFVLDPNQVMKYMSRMFVDEEINTTIYDT